MIEKLTLGGLAVALTLCCCSSDRDSFGDNQTGFGDGGVPEASAEAGPSCAAISLGADHRPLDLFIMIDKSGSMSGIPWQQAKSALSDFFTNPVGANVSAALNYFPSDAGDCGEDFYKLFAVDLGPLPSHAPALTSSLNATTPSGGTPLGSAIDGALFAAVAQKKIAPDHAVAMVIVTDGIPEGCNDDLVKTNTYVAAGLLEEGVPTFAIGIGTTPGPTLDSVALAGGTGKSLTVSDPSGLAEKLREAQNVAIGCEFVIPMTAPSGQAVDPTLVNVTFGVGTNAPHVVHAISAAGACGTAEGWYYDDPKNPKTVRLCPASCTLLAATKDPKVDLNFGCATEVR